MTGSVPGWDQQGVGTTRGAVTETTMCSVTQMLAAQASDPGVSRASGPAHFIYQVKNCFSWEEAATFFL